MKKIIVIMTILISSFSFGQTIAELYDNEKYDELIKLEKNAEELSGDELFKIGFAFFQLENDNKAIDFYDKAIKKGLDSGKVHYYKSISYCFLETYDKALKTIDIALQKEPANQKFMNQKGQIYQYMKQEDKALEIFEQAIKLPNTCGDPFFWIAYIHHGKMDFKKALDLYYVAVDSIPKENKYYKESLESIGKLEYSFTKNYLKSAEAYETAIELDNKNYELYYKLIKSYNAAKEFNKADSIFALVKIAFEQEKLPKEDMELKTISVAQFEWNDHVVVIIRSLIEPKELLDISYKVFMLSKDGQNVERRFMVEKTIQLEKNGANHLLCEQDKKNDEHLTYPYGWSSDSIPIDDLEKAVKLVLDGKMSYSAKSKFKKN